MTGLLGALGWVGYQQFPKATAAVEVNEPLLLEGQATDTSEVDFALARPAGNAVEPAASVEAPPLDSQSPFRRAPQQAAVVEESQGTGGGNPFAAFAVKQTAMAPHESEFAQAPPRISAASRENAGRVTLASNETVTPPANSVEIFQVEGQSEPAPAADTPPAQSEPGISAVASDDPFAAFAPQPDPLAQASPGAPAAFNRAANAERVPSEAEWAAAGTAPAVTPAQFHAEPGRMAPAQFEPEARPIDFANGFAAEPDPSLNRASAPAEWPAFERQPATRQPARRMGQRTVDSVSVEPAQPTSFDVPRPAAPVNDPRDEELHVVQQGETYWSIARQHYGAGRFFQALAEYNKPRISDQQSLKPGMKVLVPSATTLDTRYGKLMQTAGHAKPPVKPQSGLRVDAQGRPLYVVGEGDTLGEIARRYLGKTLRSDEIFRMNQEQLKDANSVKAGMILVLPDDAGEVRPASGSPGRR